MSMLKYEPDRNEGIFDILPAIVKSGTFISENYQYDEIQYFPFIDQRMGEINSMYDRKIQSRLPGAPLYNFSY